MREKYSADMMYFVGVKQTDLTRDFVAVDGNDIERGVIRIGGYSMSGIQDRQNGILAELVFQVRESGGELEIIKVMDDVKDFIVLK